MGPTEVFSCLCITSLISSRPPFSGLGNVTACLRRRKPIWEGLCRGVVICWVCYAKDGDKSSSPGIQQPFPSENGILVLSWGCAVTPSLFQRIVTPFPLLLISSLHFSTAHTTVFLLSCTLMCTLCWCHLVCKTKNWKTGQHQMYICTCNLKSAHPRVCALSDAGVLVNCMISFTKPGQFAGKDTEGPVLKSWNLQTFTFF